MTESSKESVDELGAERLTVEQIEWLRRLTGTYDADSSEGYYTLMDRLFDQVMADMSHPPHADTALRDAKDALALADRWIIRHYRGDRDHGCRGCVGDNVMIPSKPFTCAYHAALARDTRGSGKKERNHE